MSEDYASIDKEQLNSMIHFLEKHDEARIVKMGYLTSGVKQPFTMNRES